MFFLYGAAHFYRCDSSVQKSGTFFFFLSDLRSPKSALCLAGLKCCLPPLKDGCPFKALQRLGIQLATRFSRSNVSHIFICSFPPVPAMNIMSGGGGGGQGAPLSGRVPAHECVLCSHYSP